MQLVRSGPAVRGRRAVLRLQVMAFMRTPRDRRPRPPRPRSPARRCEECVLERRRLRMAFELSRVSRHSSRPRSRIADPVGERLGLGHVVGAEQNRRVVLAPDLADERCTSSFERGSSPVVGSSSSSSTGEVSRARASATFCCMPRDRCSSGSPRRSAGKPTRSRIGGIALARLARRHPVEARRVGEVLGAPTCFLKNDASTETRLTSRRTARLLARTSYPNTWPAAVGDQQRREQPDERRLAGAVLAEDRDALAARIVKVTPSSAARGAAPLAPPCEVLAQVADFDGRRPEGALRDGDVRFGEVGHDDAPSVRQV